jgi:ribosomal protein S18 acetylase RimI-like enzyme
MNPSVVKINYQKAQAQDCDTIATFIYKSSQELSDHFYGEKQALDFLKYCFKDKGGFFGSDNQIVGKVSDDIVLSFTTYSTSDCFKLFMQSLAQVFCFFKIKAVLIILKLLFLAYLFPSPPKNSRFLANLYVAEKYRRRGFAFEVLVHLNKMAKKNQENSLILDVFTNNEAAKKLYELSGFKIIQSKSYRGKLIIDGSLRMEKNIL